MSNKLFYLGQTIICINDDFSWLRKSYPNFGISYPVFGQRYTVRDYICGGKYPAIVLQEIWNPNVLYRNGVGVQEAGFWDARFVGAPPPIVTSVPAKRARRKETV